VAPTKTEYFNAQTYLAFVEGDLLPHYYRPPPIGSNLIRTMPRIIRSRKFPGVLLAKHHRHLEVFSLPALFTGLSNATEAALALHPKGQHAQTATFDLPGGGYASRLFATFADMQKTVPRKNPRNC